MCPSRCFAGIQNIRKARVHLSYLVSIYTNLTAHYGQEYKKLAIFPIRGRDHAKEKNLCGRKAWLPSIYLYQSSHKSVKDLVADKAPALGEQELAISLRQ